MSSCISPPLLRNFHRTLRSCILSSNCGVRGISSDNHIANELQKRFDLWTGTKNFTRIAKNLKVNSATPTFVVAELVLSEEHLNGKDTLHGGQTAALIDIICGSVLGISVKNVPINTLELSISYLNPATIAQTILIEASCLKIGKNVAFTEAVIRRKADGAIVAKGKSTLALISHIKIKDGEEKKQF